MFVRCTCVIVSTICVSTMIRGIGAQESGPYKIVFETIKDCLDKGTGEVTVTSTARTDEEGNVLLTGDLTLPYGVSDKLKANGDASIMKGKEWKPIGLIWKLPFPKGCSSLKSMAEIWFGILKAASVENTDCPIAEGTYHFVDYHIPPTQRIAGMDSIKYGRYRVRVTFQKKTRKIGCICYIANVVPQ